jgi:hypothetical protein
MKLIEMLYQWLKGFASYQPTSREVHLYLKSLNAAIKDNMEPEDAYNRLVEFM